jgi:ribosomal protein S8
MTDPIADMLTRIRNANTAKHMTLLITAISRIFTSH